MRGREEKGKKREEHRRDPRLRDVCVPVYARNARDARDYSRVETETDGRTNRQIDR